MTLDDLKSRKIAIVGLGINNQFLAKYLKKQGIAFTIVDNWTSAAELDGRLSEFDIIFRTPGLPFLSEPVQAATAQGAVIWSQTKLFFDLCPGKIIGVTGTKGKGTTTSLIYEILKRNFQFPISNFQTNPKSKIYLAGNIGKDPFEFLGELHSEDWVILELSSFQLQDLHKSPHIAVVLKITPEHLDHHQSFQEYVDAKQTIVRFQSTGDFAVLNYDNESTRGFAAETKGRIMWNSTEQEVRPGCFVRGEEIILTPHLTSPTKGGGKEKNFPLPGGEGLREGGVVIMKTSDVSLLGKFNLENITAALAACDAAGLKDFNIAKEVIREFKGLPHRLEFVADIKGVRFYNDSFSTTPETAMAALGAFSSPIILIAGGSDKNADYADLGRTIAEKQVKALLAIGITGPKIAAAARDAGFAGKIYDTGLSSMEKIVAKADEVAVSGDVVLLSPASASFDMFANYKQRGELFKKFVNKLTSK